MIISLISLAASLALIVAMVLQARQIKHLHLKTQQLQRADDQYQQDKVALVNADLAFARQIGELNRQLVKDENEIQQLINKRDNDAGYQHALRILQMGGDKEEIIANCHLSSAEAELLMNLYAYQQVIKKE